MLRWLIHQQGPRNKMQASDLDTSEPSRNRERKSIGLVCNEGSGDFTAELPKYGIDIDVFGCGAFLHIKRQWLLTVQHVQYQDILSIYWPKGDRTFCTNACSDSIKTKAQHVDLAREWVLEANSYKLCNLGTFNYLSVYLQSTVPTNLSAYICVCI